MRDGLGKQKLPEAVRRQEMRASNARVHWHTERGASSITALAGDGESIRPGRRGARQEALVGMYGSLLRVRAEDVEWIRANPREFAFDFLHYERPKPRARGILGWLKQLSPITVTGTSMSEPEPSASGRSAVDDVDLEKSWHALHFLFTGRADGGVQPMAFMQEGGEDIGEDSGGDPVARLFSPAQVRNIDAFLAALTPESLAKRYDPARMTELEIYGGAWEQDDEFDHLLESFEDVRAFVRTALEAGDWVAVHVG